MCFKWQGKHPGSVLHSDNRSYEVDWVRWTYTPLPTPTDCGHLVQLWHQCSYIVTRYPLVGHINTENKQMKTKITREKKKKIGKYLCKPSSLTSFWHQVVLASKLGLVVQVEFGPSLSLENPTSLHSPFQCWTMFTRRNFSPLPNKCNALWFAASLPLTVHLWEESLSSFSTSTV